MPYKKLKIMLVKFCYLMMHSTHFIYGYKEHMGKDHSGSKRRTHCCLYMGYSSQVKSGQVRSESLTCTFRASCSSARLSRAHVSAFACSSVQDRILFSVGRVLLYAPSSTQDSTHHNLWYTSCGALAGIQNRSMDPSSTKKLKTEI